MENSIEKVVLAVQDLELFRVKPNDKRPAVKGGFYAGKKGFDVARTLALGYNIGFKMEPNFVGIDMDEDPEKGYEGIKVIQNLEKELGSLPQTYTQRTPRGGLHKVFLATGLKTKPTGKITPAVDVKYSGYLLFHGSKVNGKYYQAIDGVTQEGKLLFSTLPQNWIDYIESNTQIVNPKKKESDYNYEPESIEGDFKRAYDECPFIRRCVDSSATLSEPEWHLFARYLNLFDNGEELFMKYSKNHPEFNTKASLEKFSNAKKYCIRCSSIADVSDACKKCNNILLGEIKYD